VRIPHIRFECRSKNQEEAELQILILRDFIERWLIFSPNELQMGFRSIHSEKELGLKSNLKFISRLLMWVRI
jgi:hypothetical protein